MTGLCFKKNVVKALAKRVFTPLQLTEAASAADTGIHKNTCPIRDESINNSK